MQETQLPNQPTTDNTAPKKKRSSLGTVVGVVVLLLILLGSAAGLYLTQYTSQDVRQQASVSAPSAIACGTVTCKLNIPPQAGPDCNAPFESCQERAEAYCGVGNVESLGDPPPPANCGGGGVAQCPDGSGPAIWCSTWSCTEDTNGDGQCTSADNGAVETIGTGIACNNPPIACGQVDIYRGSPGDYGSFCGTTYHDLSQCGTPTSLSCGQAGCTQNSDCQAGLQCITADNDVKYCSKPEYVSACGQNPSTASCCEEPVAQPKQISGQVRCAEPAPTGYPAIEPGIINVPIVTTDAGGNSLGTAKTVAGGGFNINLQRPIAGDRFAVRIAKAIRSTSPDTDPAFIGAGGGTVCNPLHENCSFPNLVAGSNNFNFTTTVKPSQVTGACVANTDHLTFSWRMANDTQGNTIRNYIVRLDKTTDDWDPTQLPGGNRNDYYFLAGLDQTRVGACNNTTKICTFSTQNLPNQFTGEWSKPWNPGTYKIQVTALSNYSQNSGGGIPTTQLYDNLVELCSGTYSTDTCNTEVTPAACVTMGGEIASTNPFIISQADAASDKRFSYNATARHGTVTAQSVKWIINKANGTTERQKELGTTSIPTPVPVVPGATVLVPRADQTQRTMYWRSWESVLAAAGYTRAEIQADGIEYHARVTDAVGDYCDLDNTYKGGPKAGTPCTFQALCKGIIKLESDTPTPLICGQAGCQTDTDCAAGLVCTQASNNKYCAKPEYATACANNPTTANCCEAQPVEPICRDVAILDQNGTELNPATVPTPFKVNQAIQLRCAANDPDNLIVKYEFKITEPDGTVIQGTALNPTGNSALSKLYTIRQFGSFKAECRACKANNACQPYTEIK